MIADYIAGNSQHHDHRSSIGHLSRECGSTELSKLQGGMPSSNHPNATSSGCLGRVYTEAVTEQHFSRVAAAAASAFALSESSSRCSACNLAAAAAASAAASNASCRCRARRSRRSHRSLPVWQNLPRRLKSPYLR